MRFKIYFIIGLVIAFITLAVYFYGSTVTDVSQSANKTTDTLKKTYGEVLK